MDEDVMKETLLRYLRSARGALVWKVEGLSEYDARRPMTPTGTNLLGLVKHLALIEAGYFGECFGREPARVLPWYVDPEEDNEDMWARADESRAEILERYRAACAYADELIEAEPLGAPAVVPWWDRDDVTLFMLLVHMIAETDRHLGHADIVRELVDGAVGLRDGVSNLPDHDESWWGSYVRRLEAVAEEAAADQP